MSKEWQQILFWAYIIAKVTERFKQFHIPSKYHEKFRSPGKNSSAPVPKSPVPGIKNEWSPSVAAKTRGEFTLQKGVRGMPVETKGLRCNQKNFREG